ncbi:MAG: COG1361 S-layer family protein [Candidatus Woesearchaeota archaeon]
MKKLLILLILFVSLNTAAAYQLDIVNTAPAPLTSGTYADITIMLSATHSEGVRENIEIEILQNQNIVVLGDATKTINFLRPGDIYTRTYRIFIAENLPTANIPITFEIRDQRTTKTSPQELFVQRSQSLPNINIGSINTIPSDIIKDSKNNKIIINLQNIGDKTAQLLTARLVGNNIKESSAFTLSDSIPELMRGQTQQLEFRFDLDDVNDNKIPMNLILNYQIEDVHGNFKPITQTIPFDMTIKQTPDIKIVDQEALNNILVGRNSNQIKITLENQGLEEAQDVRVRLYPDVSYPFDFTKTNYYVSSLMDTSEQAQLIIEFDVLNTGTVRTYPMNVEIESVVGTARYIQRDRINIEVIGESRNLSQLIRNSMLILSLLIALFFGYKTYKSKKKETKDS